jgi:hypothetical protein
LESKWRTDDDEEIAASYAATVDELMADGYRVFEIPMEQECLKHVVDPKRGKNMFVLGMLCAIYSFDLQTARERVAFVFAKKGESVIDDNIRLLEAGHLWAAANLDIKFRIPPSERQTPQIVVNGNISLGLGVMASGMEVCAMYPITPATSASHYLSDVFENVGGTVHQAEDEIAACAFAIGASYAGKCAVTITSGPGFALKQETISLAVMAEIPWRSQHRSADQGGARGSVVLLLRRSRRHAEGGDGGRRYRGLFPLDDRGAKDRRDLQYGCRRADRRQSGIGAATLPAAAVQRGVAGAAGGSERYPRGRQTVRLGRHDRPRAEVHSRPTEWHALSDRAGPRSHEPRRL